MNVITIVSMVGVLLFSVPSSYGADNSITIGVSGNDQAVFYKEQDPINRKDPPMNGNITTGNLDSLLTNKSCHRQGLVFYDAAGNEVSYGQVLRMVNQNVNCSYLATALKDADTPTVTITLNPTQIIIILFGLWGMYMIIRLFSA